MPYAAETEASMKKALCAVTAVLLIFLTLAACGKTDVDTPGESTSGAIPATDAETAQAISIVDNGKSDYIIIYPNKGSRQERAFALDLSVAIRKACGAKVGYSADNKAEPTEREIIIGDTSRPETAEALTLMGSNDYIITLIGEKLVFYSKDHEKYASLLLDLFLDHTLKEKSIMTDSNFKLSATIETIFSINDKCASGKQICATATLCDEKSAPRLMLYKDDKNGYFVEITEKAIILYKLENGQATEYARKHVALSCGVPYRIECVFDGKYIRFYLYDQPEGYSPWPKFEVMAEGYEDAV